MQDKTKISIRKHSFKRASKKYYSELMSLRIKRNGAFGDVLKNAKRGYFECDDIYIAKINGRIIGWGILNLSSSGFKELSCYVHHQFRRKGIGSKICQRILKHESKNIFNEERYVPKYVLKFWDKNGINY